MGKIKRILAMFLIATMAFSISMPALGVLASEDYSDMVLGEKPANIVADPDNSEGKFKMNYTFNQLTVKSDRYIYGEKARGVDTYWCAGDHYVSYENGGLTEPLEAYANYAVSARLRNETPEVDHPPVFGVSSNVNGSNTANGGTIISIPVESPEYKTYAGVLTINNQAGNLICFGQDSTINRTSYTEFAALAMDRTNGGSLYIAKEVPYDVKIESLGMSKVFPGDAIKVKAEIVNQVGTAYGEQHNFAYTALNADRTAVEENITITANGDGTVTVEFADDIALGSYVIFAESTDVEFAGFKRGLTIEVVDSSAFADTVPVTPESLINNGYSYNGGGNSAVGTSWAPDDSTAINFQAKNGDVTYNPGGWIAQGSGIKTLKDGSWLLPNTTYVYKTTIKSVGTEPSYFNIEYQGNVKKVTTNEYGTQGYAPGFEYEEFVATFSTGDNTTGTLWVGMGSGKMGNAVYQKLYGAQHYIGVETPYDVVVDVTGISKLFPDKSTTLYTEVVNQGGIKGTLSQDVTYVVLNEDRTAFAQGITVIPGTEGTATVEVAEDVVAGKYNILAISSYEGIQHAAQIEVVTAEGFADKTAEKPANFLTDPGNKDTYGGQNYAFGTIDSSNYNSQNMVKYSEKAGKADPYWGAGPTSVGANYKNALYEMGKTYVVSVRLMNGAPEKKATVKAGFNYKAGRGTPVSWDVSNSDEFQTYTATFSPTIADGAAVYIGFAGNVDRNDVTDENRGVLLLDYSNGGSLYVAEEVAYEVNNVVTGAIELWSGETTTLATEVVNQVGMKSTLSQDVTYVALNAERSAFVDGITVTKGANGTATVEVGEDVVGGEYVILAISDEYDIQKAAVITVVGEDNFADYEKGDMPANMFTNPKGYNLTGGNSGVGVGWSDGASTPPVHFSSKDTFELKPNDTWAAHGSKLTGYTGSLEANTSYVTSAYVKHLSGEGTPTFTIAYQHAYNKHRFPVEHDIIGFALTNEYQQYKGTFNTGDVADAAIWVGLRSASAGDVVALDNTQGWYLAKEEAYDIAVESAATSLLAGETAEVTATVLNQIETTGTLEQEFTWYALNDSRTAFTDAITVVPGEAGVATIEVAADAQPGTYVIYAKSSYGMGKGIEIEVADASAKVIYTEIFTVDDVASFYAGVVGATCDTVKFFIASFTEANNILVDVESVDVTVVDGVAEIASEVAPEVSIAGADYVKVFVWDAATLAPIDFDPTAENFKNLAE